MIMKNIVSLSKNEPLTVAKVKAFVDALEVGDVLPTIIRVKVWTSNSNFVFKEKAAKVTVFKKYPHLVETDHGVISSNELVIGYIKMAGLNTEAAAEAHAAVSHENRHRAA